MLSLKLSKDVSKRSRAENKGKKEKKCLRIPQLNDGSKTDMGGSREIKVREVGSSVQEV